jgi:hypothetical protein
MYPWILECKNAIKTWITLTAGMELQYRGKNAMFSGLEKSNSHLEKAPERIHSNGLPEKEAICSWKIQFRTPLTSK